MSKRNAIVITLATVIIALMGLVAWYLFLSPSAGNKSGGVKDILSAFFPSGTNPGNTGTSSTTPSNNDNGNNASGPGDVVSTTPAPVTRQITASPTSGFTLIEDKKDGPVARYMEIETGNVWSAPLSVLSKMRITNTTIPQTHETFFTGGGKSLITRYLASDQPTIKTFGATIHATTTSLGAVGVGDLQGSYLKDNITDLAVSGAGDKIFYLTQNGIGADGILANIDGSKATKIFSSPLRDWLPQWAGTNLYITSKASAEAPGYLYSINTGSGAQTRIIGGIYGFTTNVNPKNTILLYSDSGGGGIELFSYDLSTKVTNQLPLSTLSEKCAFDPNDASAIYCAVPTTALASEYPDSWYKGIVGFNDGIWKMNLKTGEINNLGKFSDITSNPIDGINLQVSKNSDYLVFQNKYDLSLWSIKLK